MASGRKAAPHQWKALNRFSIDAELAGRQEGHVAGDKQQPSQSSDQNESSESEIRSTVSSSFPLLPLQK